MRTLGPDGDNIEAKRPSRRSTFNGPGTWTWAWDQRGGNTIIVSSLVSDSEEV